jgi:hypothetical protein
VTVTNFTVNTKRSVLTAKAGDARIKLLRLDLSDPDAAALNDAFETDAFEKGLLVGTATVLAKTG